MTKLNGVHNSLCLPAYTDTWKHVEQVKCTFYIRYEDVLIRLSNKNVHISQDTVRMRLYMKMPNSGVKREKHARVTVT